MPPKTVPVSDFNLYLLEALKDPQILVQLNKAIDRQALLNEIDIENSALVQSLRRQLNEKDVKINALQSQVDEINKQVDDLEQYSRKKNVRLDGITEVDGENTHEVILETCNNVLGLADPITLSDIDNSHRLPAPRNAAPGAPRPLIVKFTKLVQDVVCLTHADASRR